MGRQWRKRQRELRQLKKHRPLETLLGMFTAGWGLSRNATETKKVAGPKKKEHRDKLMKGVGDEASPADKDG